ncbi:MAG: transposase [Alphaproteobacteria bacterium]|nr:transposase [Alphaproteobacteria bacterium]
MACIEMIREAYPASYLGIMSGNVSPAHVHMLISASPHLAVSKDAKGAQYTRGRSSRKRSGEFQKLRKRY